MPNLVCLSSGSENDGEGDETSEVAVDCSTEATSQLIARATADDQDSDDEEGMPNLVSSDSENDDEASEEEKHEEVKSGSSATAVAPPPTKIGPNLRRCMGGYALLPAHHSGGCLLSEVSKR